jgi:hypothetical protein
MHGQEHIADMHLAAAWRVHAIGADQDAPWPQHAAELTEHPVLHRSGGDVVQHGQARDGGEPAAVKRERGSVGLHDLDAGARQASSQRGGQLLIQLDRHQSWDAVPQGIGDQTRAGAHLEHLVAELAAVDHPRQQHVLDDLGPLGARTELQVLRVHPESVAHHELPAGPSGGTTGSLIQAAPRLVTAATITIGQRPLSVGGLCQARQGCIVHTIHDTTLLVSMLPPRAAKDNDEVEWQGGRVFLHLGVRRDDADRR